MAIKTTYTCDRCGHEQDNDDQMLEIGIVYRHLRFSFSPHPGKNALWCRKCTDEVGITPVQKTADPQPPPRLTLEDLIRELIREEVRDA